MYKDNHLLTEIKEMICQSNILSENYLKSECTELALKPVIYQTGGGDGFKIGYGRISTIFYESEQNSDNPDVIMIFDEKLQTLLHGEKIRIISEEEYSRCMEYYLKTTRTK